MPASKKRPRWNDLPAPARAAKLALGLATISWLRRRLSGAQQGRRRA